MQYILLNLSQVEETFAQSRLWSSESPNLVSFQRNDYLPSDLTLMEEVKHRILMNTGQPFNGEVLMLTTLRSLGYCMNPISLFFCYETATASTNSDDALYKPKNEPEELNAPASGDIDKDVLTNDVLATDVLTTKPIATDDFSNATQPRAARLNYVLVEVHNTPWDERHVYVLKRANRPKIGKQNTQQSFAIANLTTAKEFHVSPFMPMDTDYDWQISDPQETLNVSITVKRESAVLFTANMDLTMIDIKASNITGLIIKQAAQAFKTVSAIYIHALILWIKKVKFHPHPRK